MQINRPGPNGERGVVPHKDRPPSKSLIKHLCDSLQLPSVPSVDLAHEIRCTAAIMRDPEQHLVRIACNAEV